MGTSLGGFESDVISATHMCAGDRAYHSYNGINAPTSVFVATTYINLLLPRDTGSFAAEATPQAIDSFNSGAFTTEYNNATAPVTGFSLNGNRHNHEVTTDSDAFSVRALDL